MNWKNTIDQKCSDAKDILLTTIWHTGTHSAQELLEKARKKTGASHRISQTHCNKSAVKLAHSGQYEVISLYRDPYRTASSWWYRDRFRRHPAEWLLQWEYWGKILPVATLIDTETLPIKRNVFRDSRGLHAALDEGDLDHYHRYVPMAYLDQAHEILEKYKEFINPIAYGDLITGEEDGRETYPR